MTPTPDPWGFFSLGFVAGMIVTVLLIGLLLRSRGGVRPIGPRGVIPPPAPGGSAGRPQPKTAPPTEPSHA